MPLLLQINTALTTAMVGLAADGELLAEETNDRQKDHAAFLNPAITELLRKTGLQAHDIDAVAVVHGPGSYTGLRVGLACAKGWCFARQLPLITIDTLSWMAAAVDAPQADFICPMIDARRMEVFTACFDRHHQPLSRPEALVLNQDSYLDRLDAGLTAFTGDGAGKFKALCKHPKALFVESSPGGRELARLSQKAFGDARFADLAYAEPLYVKDFHTGAAGTAI